MGIANILLFLEDEKFLGMELFSTMLRFMMLAGKRRNEVKPPPVGVIEQKAKSQTRRREMTLLAVICRSPDLPVILFLLLKQSLSIIKLQMYLS